MIWHGSKPECDFCHKTDSRLPSFVDGATRFGPWAMMCISCHHEKGVGLGLGRGQQYQKREDGFYHKIGG